MYTDDESRRLVQLMPAITLCQLIGALFGHMTDCSNKREKNRSSWWSGIWGVVWRGVRRDWFCRIISRKLLTRVAVH